MVGQMAGRGGFVIGQLSGMVECPCVRVSGPDVLAGASCNAWTKLRDKVFTARANRTLRRSGRRIVTWSLAMIPNFVLRTPVRG